MDDADGLVELERRGWDALSSGGGSARAFYDDVLSEHPVFVFPGGMVLDDRAGILDSMGGPPWSGYTLTDARVVHLGEGAAAVVYRADADRGGTPYSATCTSTYVREGGTWRLSLHQQSP